MYLSPAEEEVDEQYQDDGREHTAVHNQEDERSSLNQFDIHTDVIY